MSFLLVSGEYTGKPSRYAYSKLSKDTLPVHGRNAAKEVSYSLQVGSGGVLLQGGRKL